MALAIKAENLSKAYQLGQIGTGTISRDIERWVAKVRGKEDPFLSIGETNDRTTSGNSDMVWSLKDVSFDIKEGDAVGVIGRNGAGKSTLLKLLSRVTAPTTGGVKVKGRIASLLEVGTGFHPELSGRENIYLNGAILGMRKKEITRKFDEIVAFAGVERYIDTPVKRYSSGMYVRLAFAVAAHLESEILIVDEVLAVGDAEFQKKCLGKMGEVSKGEGRTVLFVSHNLTAIAALCNSSIYLKNGELVEYNRTKEVLNTYNKSLLSDIQFIKKYDISTQLSREVKVIETKIVDSSGNLIRQNAKVSEQIGIELTFRVNVEQFNGIPNFNFYDENKKVIFPSMYNPTVKPFAKGEHKVILWIPNDFLTDMTYIIGVGLNSYSGQNVVTHFYDSEALALDVIDDFESCTRGPYLGSYDCVIRPSLNWTIQKN